MQSRFKISDLVQVRSKEEILATLDGNGCLNGMPFMPEMLQFCGQQFRVYKSAHKTCDYSGPEIRSRWVDQTVHLETRCDGSAHDGCQAGCLLYWKDEWLKPVEDSSKLHQILPIGGPTGDSGKPRTGCSEEDLWAHTKVSDPQAGSPTYFCQTTQIPQATRDLNWWDLRQYFMDYRSGNVRFGQIFRGALYSAYYSLSEAGIGVGRPMRWLYNKMRYLWRGSIWPRTPGIIPHGLPTPAEPLNLQPGELVRVKSHAEILRTVTTSNMNRGMSWDAELVPYCGGTYRVLKRVTKIIHERTCKMQEMKTPCIILDSVVCQARYSFRRMHCPKGMYPYWREIWLERVEPAPPIQASEEEHNSAVVEPIVNGTEQIVRISAQGESC